MNTEPTPQSIFTWSLSVSQRNWEVEVFSDGSCTVLDMDAFELLTPFTSPEDRLLKQLFPSKEKAKHTTSVEISFDDYCVIREIAQRIDADQDSDADLSQADALLRKVILAKVIPNTGVVKGF